MTMAKRFVNILTTVLVAFMALSIGCVLLLRFVPVCLTPLMLIRQVEAMGEGRVLSVQHEWIPLEDISPSLLEAVIENEDAHFYEHRGLDAEAICKAWEKNQRKGYICCGGSTISQQTAKNVFCTPARTWTRKAVETYFTILIELFWGKERILEVYLNVVELGDGIFGAEAASQYYFHRPASLLRPSEANALAGMLPMPRGTNIEWLLYDYQDDDYHILK